ncbi:alpha/beta fold hydrolase [Heyndrickxia acidicola]|uniref:Probable acyltransferase n=1 Tax=Heyndrickxia acidicola TaxID=209389 RepID=A0ABU6MJ42_9BACI|nr:homoserine O-acetyltransferase [Heyndrickxia acidicola]MED1203070.1 homoserine O-acetyltransferase [Heyndrickxia acidicola]
MIIQKRTFSMNEFTFEAGVSLPIQIGYETYGTLNEDRSNAILICHFFSGSSHAAGKYANEPENGETGWWDGLIGPGKAFDTNRYFIISSDVLCNVNANNPHVITTGPSSINPDTGKKYGLIFPEVTIRDFVRVQYELLKSLGIEKLYCVAGPSMGGMQAIQWAVDYPDMMQKVISVISGPRISAYTGVMPLQMGIDAIRISPEEGLRMAIKMMTFQNRSFEAATQQWGHPLPISGPLTNWDWEKQPHTYFQELDHSIDSRIGNIDAEHWTYITRAIQLFNIEIGYGSYEQALERVQAEVLAMPVSSDLLFPPQESRDMVERLQKLGKTAHYNEVMTDCGHLAALLEYEDFIDPIKQFLEK